MRCRLHFAADVPSPRELAALLPQPLRQPHLVHGARIFLDPADTLESTSVERLHDPRVDLLRCYWLVRRCGLSSPVIFFFCFCWCRASSTGVLGCSCLGWRGIRCVRRCLTSRLCVGCWPRNLLPALAARRILFALGIRVRSRATSCRRSSWWRARRRTRGWWWRRGRGDLLEDLDRAPLNVRHRDSRRGYR